MKLRILNYGINAEHEQMRRVDDLFTGLSFSDFDAFIFDPAQVLKELCNVGHRQTDLLTTANDESGSLRSALERHGREVLELVWYKGGIVICILRDNSFEWKTQYPTGQGRTSFQTYHPYFLLDKAFSHAGKTKIIRSLIHGEGEQIRFSNGMLPTYLRGFKDKLRFEATIGQVAADEITSIAATDSLNRIVAAEIKVGNGSILLLPITTERDTKRVGAALVQSVRELISKDLPDVAPTWIEQITVPGANYHDKEIEVFRTKQLELSSQLEVLETARVELLDYRRLLYTTGKHILEPAVRRAFRLLGYDVSEPESYEGEWDLEMRDRNGHLCIGEVEGPEGAVDVDKFRQALDYHNDNDLAGDDNKGLLVGNAHRLMPLDKRPNPFTEHAMRGAAKVGMALIPTPDLFRAICDVLVDDSEQLKAVIQDSINACNGVWSWPPPQSQNN